MKKTLTFIVLITLVWGCAKKSNPTAATGNHMAPNNGGVVNTPASTPATTPAATTPAAATTAPVASTPATPEGSRTPAEASTTKTPAMLGQTTYNSKCGGCHGLKVVGDYTATRWISIMQVMAPKAHLNDTEKENVLAYVKSNAKQ